MFFQLWLRRVRYMLHKSEETGALSEEMQLHRELLRRKLMESGTPNCEAERLARVRFGNEAALQEQSISIWEWTWMSSLLKDFRQTVRSLGASPFFTVLIILTLALGIGANTAIFSVANVVLLRMLPVSDPGKVFYLNVLPGQPNGIGLSGNPRSSFGYSVYTVLRKQREAFAAVLAYVPLSFGKVPVRTADMPHEASVEMVSGDFFQGLGVTLACGSGFKREDESRSSALAVVSAGFAAEQFGTPCNAVGKTVFIKGVPFTATGVAPPRFTGVESSTTDIWVPLQRRTGFNAWGMARKDYHDAPRWWCLRLAVRIRPELSVKAALAKATPAFLRAAYEPLGGKPKQGEEQRRLDLIAARGLAEQAESFTKPLQILIAMVALILLIACGNVATLLVARNAARQREFSIRLAIGGSKARLFQLLLVESSILVTGGAAAGWMFSLGATRVLARWAEIDVSLAPDGAVLTFTLGIAIAVGLLFGLAPMRAALRGGPALALKQSVSTAYLERSKSSVRRVVLSLQVASGLVLILSAALLTATLRNLQSLDKGFNAKRLLAFGVTPPANGGKPEANDAFFHGFLQSIRELPGVEGATTAQNRPGSGWSNNTGVSIDGQDPQQSGAASNMVRWNGVGPNFFQLLGVPLRAGRYLYDDDSAKALKVALVNETFVRVFFPHRSPLGHQVSFDDRTNYSVIGVVRNNKYSELREDETPMLYADARQFPGIAEVLLRTSGDPMRLLPSIRKKMMAFSSNIVPLRPMTLEMQFDQTIANESLMARLSLFFGGLALLLVSTGLYGTLAYSVARRTPELGIRMAIGAQRPRVLWMVMRENLGICLAGVALGLPLSFYAADLLASQLYGLSPHDWRVALSACIVLLAVTAAASAIPAYRAASVDPMRALRYE